MNQRWVDFLRKNGACRDGYAEAHAIEPSEWWRTTQRGDWMVWVMRRSGLQIEKVVWVKIAIFAARQTRPYATPGDDRPRIAIEAAESWVTSPNPSMSAAANAAYAAYTAAYAAAYAAYAAYTAADAAAYAASAAAYAGNANANAYAADIRSLIPDLDWSFLGSGK